MINKSIKLGIWDCIFDTILLFLGVEGDKSIIREWNINCGKENIGKHHSNKVVLQFLNLFQNLSEPL